ncbi:MAG: PfkB family carbohydrate kinase [Candidatus Heimdallarchaeota archaeon]
MNQIETKKIVIIGELHQDLYYESEFYEQIVDEIVKNLVNLIRYNPDDLNKSILERFVKKGINDTPKKVMGLCYFKRGGNGNNSAEYLANLGIPTKLVSVIGRGSEWMIEELMEIGIDTESIFQINEITPVSTIIKSNFTTKIHLAPNLKDKMNFNGINIEDKIFNNGKIIFSTPLAEKFIDIFERGSNFGLITAFNIERQKIQSIDQLSNLIRNRKDLLFLNLKDAYLIMERKANIEEVDQCFQKFAYIRVYTAGKEGSYVKTDYFTLNFPGIEVDAVVDRTGAGDCYAAGFLTKLYEYIKDKEVLVELMHHKNVNKLKEILNACIKFATFTAIYKVTKQMAPSKEELELFIKNFQFK